MKKKIELGNKVKDIVSGLVGITTQKTEYLNGCIQYGVTPSVKKDSTDIVTYSIDQDLLEYVGPGVKPEKKEKITGEDVAALLHSIHTHGDQVKKSIEKAAFNFKEKNKKDDKIYYAEEDLLPVLEALGLPAPVWGKSLSIEEWKKEKGL